MALVSYDKEGCTGLGVIKTQRLERGKTIQHVVGSAFYKGKEGLWMDFLAETMKDVCDSAEHQRAVMSHGRGRWEACCTLLGRIRELVP